MKNMRKQTRDIIGSAMGSIIGLSLGGPVANAGEAAATSTGMGAGGAALARQSSTLYMFGLTKKSLSKKR